MSKVCSAKYDDLGHAAYEEAKDFNQRVYNFLQHK